MLATTVTPPPPAHVGLGLAAGAIAAGVVATAVLVWASDRLALRAHRARRSRPTLTVGVVAPPRRRARHRAPAVIGAETPAWPVPPAPPVPPVPPASDLGPLGGLDGLDGLDVDLGPLAAPHPTPAAVEFRAMGTPRPGMMCTARKRPRAGRTRRPPAGPAVRWETVVTPADPPRAAGAGARHRGALAVSPPSRTASTVLWVPPAEAPPAAEADVEAALEALAAEAVAAGCWPVRRLVGSELAQAWREARP